MRLVCTLVIAIAGIALSVMVWFVSGGRVAFLFLPLIFAVPFLFRRR